MRNAARTLRPLGLAALLLAAGCGKSTVFNDRVEGTVKMDGVPLARVMVQYVPAAEPGTTAPASTGFTDDNGKYQLTHDARKPGAAVGKHRVVILQGRGGAPTDDPEAQIAAPAPAGRKVPLVYTLAGKTPLVIDVTREEHAYDLNLTANAGP